MTALPHIEYFLGANSPAGFYSLYQSDNTLSAWKLLGNFSSKLEIESCFIWEDKVIVTDTQGEHYQLVFCTHE